MQLQRTPPSSLSTLLTAVFGKGLHAVVHPLSAVAASTKRGERHPLAVRRQAAMSADI